MRAKEPIIQAPGEGQPLKPGPFLRLVLPSLLTMALFMVALFMVILPELADGYLERKRETIRELTRVAWDTLAYYHRQEAAGKMSRSQAQDQAVAQVRRMSYGQEGKDYFWINDMLPRMIMHPYRPDLEGKSVAKMADPSGKLLFVEMARVARERGQGFVDYMWQWKDDPKRIVPKLSFVREFKPWGWVVGTGIYVEDVARQISAITSRVTWISLAILAIVALLEAYMVRRGVVSEKLRLSAQRESESSRWMLRLVMDNIPQLIFWKDTSGRYLGGNRAVARQMGLESPEDLKGLTDRDVDWASDLSGTLRGLESQVMVSGQAQMHAIEPFATGEGQVRWMDTNRIPLKDQEDRVVGILCTCEDITARKEMEQMLSIQDKMASLGRVAAGIAHEIRNPLSGVNMYLSALKNTLETGQGPDPLEVIEKATRASGKIEGVIKRVLDFSRPGKPKLKWFDLNQVVEEVIDLSKVTLRKGGITLQTHLAPALPQVHADAQLLGQVVMNLVTNAVQALEGWQGEKTISLASSLEYDRIVIRVADSGPGVDPAIAGQIFDPFFTDKKGGSGIGLSLCHRIVSDHGGSLSLAASKWGGAEFTIKIPASVHWGYDSHG